MAEIILFRPIEKFSRIFGRPPLGLLYVAGPLVNKGVTVKIIDMETCRDWLGALKSAVDSSTICAGISVMTGYQIKGALDFSKELKKIKSIPVIWGGLHPTLLPLQTLKSDLVDIVVIGEGEKRFLELVGKIKNNENLDSVQGIIFKQDGEIKSTKPQEDFLDLDSLSTPPYELLDVEYYSSKKRRFMNDKRKILDLNTDRGCPYRCAFCYNIKFNKRRWRAMSAEKVLDMIEEIKRKYNVDAINFVADNFFVDKNRVYNICRGIIDRKFDIKWHSDMRIDTFLRYETDLIELIKKSGCTTLTFGVESGSDRILNLIHKDICRDDVLKANQKAKNFDFMRNYHFMIGFPGEQKKDIIETMRLIRVLKRDKNAVIYGPSTYVPYPGTPLYDKCIELGFAPPNRLEGWIDYDWDETSKLPSFSKNFKDYLVEIWHISHASGEDSHGILIKKNIVDVIYDHYYKLRFIGLIHGIRLFDFEKKVARFLIFLKRELLKKLQISFGRRKIYNELEAENNKVC